MMPWRKNNHVKYHVEDTDCFCAAASLMMILGFKQPAVNLVEQSGSFRWMHDLSCPSNSTNCKFAVTPDALALGLDHYRTSLGARFQARSAANAYEMASYVVSAIYADDPIPPAVLRNGCAHWIVVADVETDTEPAPGRDFSINKFFVNIPALGPAPVSHDPDDVCGRQSGFGATGCYTMYGWTKDFPVCGELGSRIVGVFSDRTAKIGNLKPLTVGTYAALRREDGIFDRFLTADDARSAAIFGAMTCVPGLVKDEMIAETQHLVQRIDRVDQYYYIVRVRNQSTGLDAVARLDAWNGELIEISYDPASSEVPSLEQVATELNGYLLGPSYGPVARLQADTAFVLPILAWRPCLESMDPFAPLHRVVQGHRMLFRDRNGILRDSLTPLAVGC